MLLKENKLWWCSFIDDWQHPALILLTTDYIGNLDGSICDRSGCTEVGGLTALEASELIHNVLAQHVNSAVSRMEQLELSSGDALLSLRPVGRLCDKLAMEVSQPKSTLRILKS